MATQRVTAQIAEPPYGLNRLPHLGSSLLQVLISNEAQSMWKEESWQKDAGRSARTLVKYPDLRIVLVSMKAGTRFKQHKTSARFAILILVTYASTFPMQPWKYPGESCWRSTATYLTTWRQIAKARSC